MLCAAVLSALGYIGLSAGAVLARPYTLVCAHAETWQQSVAFSGVIVRRETVVQAPLPLFEPVAGSAGRVSAGTLLGWSGQSEGELRRAQRSAALETQDVSFERSAAALSQALAAHDTAALFPAAARVRERLCGQAVSAPPDTAPAPAPEEARGVYAPVSGVFLPELDGWEALSYPPEEMDVAALRALLSAPARPSSGCGKLVGGSVWYLAALVEDTQELQAGQTVTLELPAVEARALVLYVSQAEQGQRAAVFRCSRALDAVLTKRFVTGRAVTGEQEGLCVPQQALHRREDGSAFVYVDELSQTRETPVELLESRSGRVLLRGEGLREGSFVRLDEGTQRGMSLG